jgi:hypothetical protein
MVDCDAEIHGGLELLPNDMSHLAVFSKLNRQQPYNWLYAGICVYNIVVYRIPGLQNLLLLSV